MKQQCSTLSGRLRNILLSEGIVFKKDARTAIKNGLLEYMKPNNLTKKAWNELRDWCGEWEGKE